MVGFTDRLWGDWLSEGSQTKWCLAVRDYAKGCFEFQLGVHANYNQSLGLACVITGHTSPDCMINDCSNVDVGTMTLIDVTLPMTLLTHSEMDLVECMTNCVSVSLSLSLNQCCRSSAPGKTHFKLFYTFTHIQYETTMQRVWKKTKKKTSSFLGLLQRKTSLYMLLGFFHPTGLQKSTHSPRQHCCPPCWYGFECWMESHWPTLS